MSLTIRNVTYSFKHNKIPFDGGQNVGHDFILYKTTHRKDTPFIRKTATKIRALRLARNYVEADKLRSMLALRGISLEYYRDGRITWRDWQVKYEAIFLLRTRWLPTEKGIYRTITILGLRLTLYRKRPTHASGVFTLA